MERLTEKREGKNVIPLRQDGKVKWALCNAGKGDVPTQYLYGEHANKLANYEDTGYAPEQVVELAKELEQELAEYKNLDKQGLLLKLSCKVGDTVWIITHPYNVTKDEDDLGSKKEVFEAKFKSATIYKKSIQYRFTVDGEFIGEYFANDSFGKTVFLTKEEAEAKLKEMESE